MFRFLSKFSYVLTGSKLILVGLALLFLLISILDVLGIGLIGPFIALATDPSTIENKPALKWLYSSLNLKDYRYFVLCLGIGISMLFYVKSYLYFFVQKFIYDYALGQIVKVRWRLLHNYLKAPYTFHLKTNTALLIQTITAEAQQFCWAITIPLLNSAVNLLVLLALVALLAFTDLFATVSLLILFLIAFSTFFAFKNKIARWGRESGEANIEMLRIINHAVGGIKEVRIIGCESYFENQFLFETKKFASAASKGQVFQFLPRIMLEALLITFVVGFTSLSQIIFERSSQSLISVLGIFAVASIRLIPAASQFMTSTNTIRQHLYTLDRIHYDLKELEKPDGKILNASVSVVKSNPLTDKMLFEETIEIDKITYFYPGAEEASLTNVSMTIEKGWSVGFIGKSGAGKTTLVDVILGLLLPEKGDIRVDKTSIYRNVADQIRPWQNLIGYIPQSIFLMDDTVEKNIAFGVQVQDIDPERLSNAVQLAQLQDLIKSLPNGIKTSIGERGVRLSGGQRQRIGIARALYHQREILVLDEATSALDNETEALVNEAIKSLSGLKTLIIIAHRLSTIKHCDRVYVMEKGQVIRSGTYQDVVLENV